MATRGERILNEATQRKINNERAKLDKIEQQAKNERLESDKKAREQKIELERRQREMKIFWSSMGVLEILKELNDLIPGSDLIMGEAFDGYVRFDPECKYPNRIIYLALPVEADGSYSYVEAKYVQYEPRTRYRRKLNSIFGAINVGYSVSKPDSVLNDFGIIDSERVDDMVMLESPKLLINGIQGDLEELIKQALINPRRFIPYDSSGDLLWPSE